MTSSWLVTGASGMVGSAICDELSSRGEEVVPFGRAELDITDQQAVDAAVMNARPAIIINCAAYTRVDQAEGEEVLANAVNGTAVEFLAASANRAGSLLVQLSSDFVFDGSKSDPYEVNDATGPLSAYGRSKLLGEFAASRAERHLIVRTSWLFGNGGPNFVEAIRNQVTKGTNPLRVVNDQRGRPTYTPHLANAIIRLARLGGESASARGILHYADEEECSWYDLAQAVVQELGSAVEVLPVRSEEFPRAAPRPSFSVLSTERYERITGVVPESWREGLSEYLSG